MLCQQIVYYKKRDGPEEIELFEIHAAQKVENF